MKYNIEKIITTSHHINQEVELYGWISKKYVNGDI